jgi:hypothetical protein
VRGVRNDSRFVENVVIAVHLVALTLKKNGASPQDTTKNKAGFEVKPALVINRVINGCIVDGGCHDSGGGGGGWRGGDRGGSSTSGGDPSGRATIDIHTDICCGKWGIIAGLLRGGSLINGEITSLFAAFRGGCSRSGGG